MYIAYHSGGAVIINLINSSAAAINWLCATKIHMRLNRKVKQAAEEIYQKMEWGEAILGKRKKKKKTRQKLKSITSLKLLSFAFIT